MRKGWQAPGYTIVEVMIFLAVSSILLISGMSLVQGQQRKAEFNQAMRDTEQQIQDVINNVRSGFYPSQGTFTCTAVAGSPVRTHINSSDTPVGQNKDCVYLGRVIQFNTTAADKSNFSVYSIAGLREYTKGPAAATSIQRADPKHIADLTETRTFKYGLETVRVKYTSPPGSPNLGSIGFLTEPGKTDGSGNPMSGIQAVRLVPIGGTTGSTGSSTPAALDNPGNYATQDPSSGVTICLKSGGTNQYGIITVGGAAAGQLTTKLEIKNLTPTPSECV